MPPFGEIFSFIFEKKPCKYLQGVWGVTGLLSPLWRGNRHHTQFLPASTCTPLAAPTLIMNLWFSLLSVLSLGFYHRELVYRARVEGLGFRAFARRHSMFHPDFKYLILSLRGMPAVAPDWDYVGQDLPHRADLYGAAPVHFFDTSAHEIRLPPDGYTWQQQRRMLYFDRALYSPAQFEQFARILKAQLPNLHHAMIGGANVGVQRMVLYKIVGVVYGALADFTEIYRDENHALSILPDGAAAGMPGASSERDPDASSVVQIMVDRERVDIGALSEQRSDKSGRRVRDDFPIVSAGFDSRALRFLPPRIWSLPA